MWEGIYGSYNEIAPEPSEYSQVQEQTLDRQAVVDSAKQYPEDRFKLLKDSIPQGKKSTVLEIGGDLGSNWVLLNENCDLEYHILEIEKLVNHGRSIFPEITWHTEIPKLDNNLDVLYVRTALQYLEDMDKYLSECIRKNLPTKIVVDHTSFTPVKTFWTKQNYAGVKIPYCFKNFEEFDYNIKSHGYKLIYEYNDERYDYRSRVEFPEQYIYPYMKSLIYVI